MHNLPFYGDDGSVEFPSQGKEMPMRYKVNEDCIGCGQCASICPEVFALTDEGVARAKDGNFDGETDKAASEAAERCPVSAIESEP
jgi:ferredoxin